MITLKQEVIEKIRDSQQLKINMQAVLKMTYPTLLKYLRSNHMILANVNVIEMLKTSGAFEADETFITL